MITNLKINNIALIEESKMQFGEGLNVLTGETGAGKSIIIDSLSFVLGNRADKTLVKSGKDYAKVEVIFELSSLNEQIKNFFESILIEPETTIIISRYYNLNGKNECRVNGEIVTLNMLKKLSAELVDMFGQHDHQFLLDSKNHIKYLDMQSLKIENLKLELAKHLYELKDINKNIVEIGGEGELKQKNIELLTYEINEIEMADLKINEEVELENKKKMYLNSERLFTNLSDAINILNSDEENITSKIKNASYFLGNVSNISNQIYSLKDRLNSCLYEISDILEQLSYIINSIDYSEQELNEIEERLDLIKTLKRKYGNSVEEINNYLQNSKEKLKSLLNSEEALVKLNNSKQTILKSVYEVCVKLTNERKVIGNFISSKIEKELESLGMAGSKFVVNFKNNYSLNTIETDVTLNGADNIEFLFSANAGFEVRPLTKIISGGELSRFMLAFKCVINSESTIKTLVFDEIDAGIGGLIGTEVGKKLVKISRQNQVLCVTHLAQIASFADTHFKIEKSVNNNFTTSQINCLTETEKINEITRMIGSNSASEYGKLNAMELINNASQFKTKLN